MQIYLVDSNFFIQAHRAIYPLDIATGFWNKVKIPEPCNEFDIKYINTIQMFRQLGETF